MSNEKCECSYAQLLWERDSGPGTIKILEKDVSIPGAGLDQAVLVVPESVDSMAVAEQVRQRWQRVRLLISSGYARPHPGQIPDNGHVVPKPYTGTTLVRNITEVVHTLQGS